MQHKQDLTPLRDLVAKCGASVFKGIDEYYSGYSDWMKFLSGLGVQMLFNEHENLSNGIALVEITDPVASRMGEVSIKIKSATQDILLE